MITDKMTPEEIEKDLVEDLKVVNGFIDQLSIKIRKIAIKTNIKYPYKSLHYYTSKKKNKWVIQTRAENKAVAKRGDLSLITTCIYDTDHGKYAAVKITDNTIKFLIFPPHFFKRYRERKHLDNSILTQDLILRFFNENPGILINYKSDTDPERNVKIITKEGMLFGMLFSTKIAMIKTFVGEEQFFEEQKRIKEELGEVNRFLEKPGRVVREKGN